MLSFESYTMKRFDFVYYEYNCTSALYLNFILNINKTQANKSNRNKCVARVLIQIQSSHCQR